MCARFIEFVTGAARPILERWFESEPLKVTLATDAIIGFVQEQGGAAPATLKEMSERISRNGGTPLAVADGRRVLGLVHLKDIVKGGMKERLASLRAMGIRSVMITGDNPLTAAAIAAEAGVDDFLAQATPKDKLEYIKKEQTEGRLVADVVACIGSIDIILGEIDR